MKYAFWNTQKNEKTNSYLKELIEEYEPDFLGLAEYNGDGKQLENLLMSNGLDYVYLPKIGSRLDAFYRGSATQIGHYADAHHYTIKTIMCANKRVVVGIVHFPSKMYADEMENEEILREMLANIEMAKTKSRTNKVVIMGDFNMNPFESPMVAATGLQAISSGALVCRRKTRIYNRKSREFYYNPMWNFLGDEKSPIGSYYYKSPSNQAMYWNTFDQFIVNKELVKEVNLKKIKFINFIGTLQLGNERGEPTISDHFPLYFEIGEKE